MTGTDLYKRKHKLVPVIFEPPCIYLEIPSNISLNTAGNNDPASIFFLLVPVEGIRQHYDLPIIVQHFPQYS